MPVMDPDRHKDSGEMYSPDDQGNTHQWMRPHDFPCRGCPMHWQMSERDGEDLSGRVCPDVGGGDG